MCYHPTAWWCTWFSIPAEQRTKKGGTELFGAAWDGLGSRIVLGCMQTLGTCDREQAELVPHAAVFSTTFKPVLHTLHMGNQPLCRAASREVGTPVGAFECAAAHIWRLLVMAHVVMTCSDGRQYTWLCITGWGPVAGVWVCPRGAGGVWGCARGPVGSAGQTRRHPAATTTAADWLAQGTIPCYTGHKL